MNYNVIKNQKKTDCKWHINLSKSKNNNFMYVILIHPNYNHKLLANNIRFATQFQRFDHSIIEEIEHTVIYNYCNAYTIQNLLQLLFFDQLFLT